jgi:hypothetical protein
MRFHSMRAALLCLCLSLLGLSLSVASIPQARAQGADPKAGEQPKGAEGNKEGAKKAEKPDEFAELERVLGGPAGSPECAWLGWRVLNRLRGDDLDTAFRYLDLYDRFGCPAGHIQVAFRCLVRQDDIDSKIDPKQRPPIDQRVHACWKNPNTDPVISPPAAASATAPSQAQ